MSVSRIVARVVDTDSILPLPGIRQRIPARERTMMGASAGSTGVCGLVSDRRMPRPEISTGSSCRVCSVVSALMMVR